ncbi:hypothetical protein D3C85_270640 [compost metagenome]
MVMLEQLKAQTNTHTCPECKAPAYCAMTDGKSASTCWCMTVTREAKPEAADAGDVCLCKRCLK